MKPRDEEAGCLLRRGEAFTSKYRVCELLGRGSFGEVYRVEHLVLRRELALKALRPELGMEAGMRQRFLREIRIAMDFVHEGSVAIREAGEESGLLYYTMDLCEGITLDALLERDGALELGRAVHLLDQLLRCLEAAHRRGILHRDIKPSNIMVECVQGAERVQLIDFGVARIFLDAASERTSGGIVGSPAYLAPELIRTQRADARTDLYAVACVFYQMITGAPPFLAATAREVLAAQLAREPDPPSRRRDDLPAGVDAVVLGALEKDPAKRPADAAALRESLRGLILNASTVELQRGAGVEAGAPREPILASGGASPARRGRSAGGGGSSQATRPRPPRRAGRSLGAMLVLIALAALGGAFLSGWNPLEILAGEGGSAPRAIPPAGPPAGGPMVDLSGDRSGSQASEQGDRVETVAGAEKSAAALAKPETEGVAAARPLAIDLEPHPGVVRANRLLVAGRIGYPAPGGSAAAKIVRGAQGRLWIDHEERPLVDGFFRCQVPLESDGSREIALRFESNEGARLEKIVRVIRDTRAPEMRLETPSGNSLETSAAHLTIAGRVFDEHLPATIEVQNEPIPLDADGRFQAPLDLRLGSNEISLEVRDLAGNTSREHLRITRHGRTWLIASIEPPSGTTVRVPRVEVLVHTRRALHRAIIAGIEAGIPGEPQWARAEVPLPVYGENKLEIQLEGEDRSVHRESLTVRYWPFPDWMEVENLDPENIDPQTALPRAIRRRSDGSEMVLVAACEFILGNDNALATSRRSKPAHRVVITRPFYIDRYELSNEHYLEFVKATGHRVPTYWVDALPPPGKGGYPVVGISWDDAVAYGQWAGCELPREAEWELAARGTDKRSFPWGNQRMEAFANYDTGGGLGNRPRSEFMRYLFPVDALPHGASPCGAVQMAGNAWEWCADGYRERAYGAFRDYQKDPFTPPMGEERVIRGGSWFNLRSDIRTTHRRGAPARLIDAREASIGARFIRRIAPRDLPPR